MQAVHAVEKGDKLYLTAAHKADGSDDYIAGNFVRENWLLGLVAVFFLLMLLFGRMQGLNTILSLVLTCAAVFTVLVPAIASGRNIYLWTVLVCLFIVVMTLSIITGFTRKSAAAALGCLGGVCVAGLLTVFMNSAMKISGLVDEDTFMLASQDPSRNLDLLGIIFAAIVIGALGATMDVSMSISSSLEELLIKVPNMSFIELLRSGLRIGRDIMGTMANTLILAYVGSSLSLILLMLSYQNTTASLFNLEFIATEVLQALAGSIGILFTIPLTAISTGLLYRRRQQRLQNKQV
nr:YibE/F family protein [Neobittarella massiliensis]